ncbi:MAG: transglycosylase SLT domain-containing protein [Fibrobacterota bacterium]
MNLDGTRKHLISFIAGILTALLLLSAFKGEKPGFGQKLALVKERGTLRIVTDHNSFSCFLYRGRRMGFNYEIAERLAGEMGLKPEITAVSDPENMYRMLEEGRADIIAKGIHTKDYKPVDFMLTSPVRSAGYTIYCKKDGLIPEKFSDLAGRKVFVKKYSEEYSLLQYEAKSKKIPFEVGFIPAKLDFERTMELLSASDTVNLLVAEKDMAELEIPFFDNVIPAFNIRKKTSLGWAVPAGAHALKNRLDMFFKCEMPSDGVEIRFLYRKYFKAPKNHARYRRYSLLSKYAGRVSKYDGLIKELSSEYGFDWKTVAAQIFVESGFRQYAKSGKGALGLMQLMPATGKMMGGKNLSDPRENITAGIKYMRYLSELELTRKAVEKDRMNFVLAAYNCGPGHLAVAVKLAEEAGLDPGLWRSLKITLPLLSVREFYRKTRYGYCDGESVVEYVEDINSYASTYSSMIKLSRKGLNDVLMGE